MSAFFISTFKIILRIFYDMVFSYFDVWNFFCNVRILVMRFKNVPFDTRIFPTECLKICLLMCIYLLSSFERRAEV